MTVDSEITRNGSKRASWAFQELGFYVFKEFRFVVLHEGSRKSLPRFFPSASRTEPAWSGQRNLVVPNLDAAAGLLRYRKNHRVVLEAGHIDAFPGKKDESRLESVRKPNEISSFSLQNQEKSSARESF